MFRNIYLTLFFCVMPGYVEPASYDQSQQGDLNVQVDLKDLNIIALMKGGKEEYVDYDYAYDYSEMTIKPQSGTTLKPVNTSTTSATTNGPLNADNVTVATTVFVEQTTVTTLNSSSLDIETSTASIVDSANGTHVSTLSHSLASNGTSTNSTASSGGCKKGFGFNQKGDCEMILQGTGNALLKLVKLSQKLKLRREKRRTTTRG